MNLKLRDLFFLVIAHAFNPKLISLAINLRLLLLLGFHTMFTGCLWGRARPMTGTPSPSGETGFEVDVWHTHRGL